MLIGELLNNLAQKAGVKSDSEDLKSLLASPELANIKVPDDLVSTIDKGLLSIDAAKNNHPDIKKKYFADAYDGMDKQLLQLVESDTFDQADLDEIKAEKSTSKKAELIVSKLKAAKNSAKGADKDEINKQLTVAHEAARIAKAETEAVKSEYEGKIKNIHLQSAIKTVFGNYKTIYDELPGDIRSATMEAIITKALQDKNAELRTDENGNLQLLAKDGSNVFGSNHVQLTPQSFLDQSFAPILKVSGPPKPAAQQRQQQQPGTPPANEDANTGFLKSHVDQVLADMAVPRPSMM
jgi:hypothetical protein